MEMNYDYLVAMTHGKDRNKMWLTPKPSTHWTTTVLQIWQWRRGLIFSLQTLKDFSMHPGWNC